MKKKMGFRAFILSEVIMAAAVIALAALALGAALTGALQIFRVSQAVTRGRLLAASHLEQAVAGVAERYLWEGDFQSVLTVLEEDGYTLWQVEVSGPGLAEPLRMVGGP
jgi:type II secretory pathway pseudopilin PulG